MPSAQAKCQLQTHQDEMHQHLHAVIEGVGGWLSFDQYMHEALYAPGLGYYSNGLKKFGEQGDFITAPELGSGFAQCVAKQCSQVLSKATPNVLEFGAGSGALMVGVLTELAALNSLPEHYFILELSGELRARQKTLAKLRLPELFDRIVWLDAMPESGFSGCIIANEVLDAMPVKLLQRNDHGEVSLLGVTLSSADTSLTLVSKPADANTAMRFDSLLANNQNESSYRSELGVQGEAWISQLGELLSAGLVLLIDYGFNQSTYYHHDRDQGTIMCHYQHTTDDAPLLVPGLQDITAHVNFTAIATAGLAAGLDLSGYAPQSHFLISLGLLSALDESEHKSTQNHLERSQEIKKLTMPHEMGELFKVMALTKNFDQSLWGFSELNHASRLWT